MLPVPGRYASSSHLVACLALNLAPYRRGTPGFTGVAGGEPRLLPAKAARVPVLVAPGGKHAPQVQNTSTDSSGASTSNAVWGARRAVRLWLRRRLFLQKKASDKGLNCMV
ncbi:uncharacterized protein CcaverHIS019_0305080 [Cutaneotrichosporon cavernicola]|uniref:Uncharacterized protein n=1 Tax=Cutaneotrichosporon cavernicola TaxID=279322 RepID=A0AA48IIZ5_9TREE|nr:uncharacterized protein CcaverHIS019_0305080 [Cutaneotrichosporon cavernicola]BEI90438.1 hypothetical protein CcaverHIS019_0305080 [Cutaneotrichosporon cavernicola]